MYFDNVKKLATTTDGVTLNDKLLLDNATNAGRDVEWQHASDRLAFSDDTKATFGDGADLKLYHDGTNSYIWNDTGNLTIKANEANKYLYLHGDKVQLRSKTGNESFLTTNLNGKVEIYHDNVKKFATEAYGIDVTGTTQSDTLIVTGVSTVASMIFSAGTNTNGVAYFNASGQVTSTINPSNSVTTSFKILTTDTNGVPTWTSTIDCGTF